MHVSVIELFHAVCMYIIPCLHAECQECKGEEFHAAFGWLVEHRSTWCIIFLGKCAIGCNLGPAAVFNVYQRNGMHGMCPQECN